MKNFIAVTLTLVFGFQVKAGFAASSQKLDLVLQSLQKKNNFAGLSVIVLDNQNQHWSNHYGYRDIENKIKADDHTLYELASNTKPFTRLLLALQSDIALKDPISKYLPAGIHSPLFFGKEICMQDLALHTADLNSVPCLSNENGLHCYGLNSADLITDPYLKVDQNELFKFLNDYQSMVDFHPEYFSALGSLYAYSNSGMAILGELLAIRKKKSYSALLRDEILLPLEMKESQIEMPCESKNSCSNLVKVYRLNTQKDGWISRSLWHMEGMAGAGALRSSLFDMAKFLRFQMGLTQVDRLDAARAISQTPLPEATAELKSNICLPGQKKAKPCNKKEQVDLQYEGWPYDSTIKAFYHGGESGASQSMVIFTPDHSFGIVLLINSINFTADVVVPPQNLSNDIAICAQQIFGAYAGPIDFCAKFKN